MVKALIIDDEIDICYLLSGILRNKNIQSNYVNSISEAKLALKINVPHIIFLDNHLPDGMGVSFINDIKKSNPNIKVVMITAYDTPLDRRKALAEGADFFIAKPFSRDTIFQTVEQLVH
jgi:two-component system, OmpR family, response regulator